MYEQIERVQGLSPERVNPDYCPEGDFFLKPTNRGEKLHYPIPLASDLIDSGQIDVHLLVCKKSCAPRRKKLSESSNAKHGLLR